MERLDLVLDKRLENILVGVTQLLLEGALLPELPNYVWQVRLRLRPSLPHCLGRTGRHCGVKRGDKFHGMAGQELRLAAIVEITICLSDPPKVSSPTYFGAFGDPISGSS